jgi:uncharacterized protein
VVAPHLEVIKFWNSRSSRENAQYLRYKPERDALYQKYGSPLENPAFWNALSANTFITAPIAPIQLHHGITDEVVPIAFSRGLSSQLKKVGSVVELYEYPNNNHNLSRSFNLAMQRSVAFFDQYLK